MPEKEIEYQFININEHKIRKLLRKNRGRRVHDKRLMKVIIYNHPKKQKDWYIRLRDEGDKITFTIKTQLKKEFPLEHEVIIDDIDEADTMLKSLGCTERYRYEKIREKWIMKGAKEIVFDWYPAAPPLMEIEAKSKKDLFWVMKKLGLKKSDVYIQKEPMYQRLYGIPSSKLPHSLTFQNAKTKVAKLVKKNKQMYKYALKLQMKYLKRMK